MSAPHPLPGDERVSVRQSVGMFRYGLRALELVWATNRRLTILIAFLTLFAGVLPAAIAWVGQLIVDSVVSAAAQHRAEVHADLGTVLSYVGLEGLIVALLAGVQRGLSACESLLRVQLGQRVNVMILEKALTLELTQFEDSEFYDKLTRARRARPGSRRSLRRRCARQPRRPPPAACRQ